MVTPHCKNMKTPEIHKQPKRQIIPAVISIVKQKAVETAVITKAAAE